MYTQFGRLDEVGLNYRKKTTTSFPSFQSRIGENSSNISNNSTSTTSTWHSCYQINDPPKYSAKVTLPCSFLTDKLANEQNLLQSNFSLPME